MATADLEQLVLQLNANFSRFEKQLAKANGVANQAAGRIERRFKDMNRGIGSSFDAIGANIKAFAAGATIAAVAALGAAVKSAISDAASIGDLADKVGITTEELQKLQYGAVQANLSFDDLSGSLSKFSKILGEAKNGQGELLKLFQANGYSQAEVQALSLGQALGVVADFTRNAKDEQDQMVIATTAFGKAGGDMIELLRGGSNGLRQFGDDAKNAGAIIDDSLIRNAQALDDRWAALMQSLKTQTQSAVLFIIDQFAKIPSSTGVFAPSEVASRRQNAASRNSINPPRVIGAGSLGGPNEYAAPPFIPSGPARVTSIPQEEAKAEKSVTRTNDALAKRLKLISDVQDALDEAAKKADEDKAFSWAANYEDAYARVEAANERFLEQQQNMRESWMSLAAIGVDALDSIIIQGDKARDVLIGLVKQLASAALQASLLGQGSLAGLFGTAGGGGLFGSLFKGLAGGGSVGLYASGGYIPTGKMGIVGEGGGWKNAELVSGPANVTPIPKLMAAANGNSRGVTVINHFHGVAGDTTIRRIAEEATARGVKAYAQQEQTISVERNLRQR